MVVTILYFKEQRTLMKLGYVNDIPVIFSVFDDGMAIGVELYGSSDIKYLITKTEM